MYSSAASVNPGGVNANWQLTRSPPHQQQQQQQQQQQATDQQRAYGGGQNVVSQAPPPTGAPNTGAGGRSASTSGPSGQTGAGGGPPITPQYTLNGSAPPTYAYGPPGGWFTGPAQVSSPQTNMPPQVNAYGMMFDPSQQQQQPQQPTYVHTNPYETAYFQQAQAQQAPQQGLDTVPQGNYNR
jgi:hypothetical protein